MPNCCNCTYTFPDCYNFCEDIEIRLEGIEDGTYTVIGDTFSFEADALDGLLTIPSNTLNEHGVTTLRVEGYTLSIDDNVFDCFKIKTRYATAIN